MKDLFGKPVPERVRNFKRGLAFADLATSPDLPIVWSYGGGTQSISMVLLVKDGLLPKPDVVIMADTAYEKSRTWSYHDQYIQPIFDELGIPFVIAPHSLSTVDLWGGKDGETLLIPAFTTLGHEIGQCGKLPTFCSNEWKQRVFFRHAKSLGYGPGTDHPRIQVWMGMSLDELDRLKRSPTGWADYKYPLVADVPFHRSQCTDLIAKHGLPPKISSEYWMCPNQVKVEWQHLQETAPADYKKAGRLERKIQQKDSEIWFSEYGAKNRLCLDQITWSEVSGEGLLFKNEGCVSGFCNI